jgi:hypothetical protein
LEAEEAEVMKVLLKNRFFSFTRLGSKSWLVSANLRTIIEYFVEDDEFGELLMKSVAMVAPALKVSERWND